MQSYDKWSASQKSYSVARSAQSERYFVRTRMVERVTVKNLRAICDLEVDVPLGRTDRAPWLMLLGENGTGKSTVLQAAALALMGDRRRAELGLDPAHLLRSGTRRGAVEVLLTGVEEPIRLEIRRSGFTSTESEPKVLLLGYGATRLLPRPGMSAPLLERIGV